jgi:hypothetical protein
MQPKSTILNNFQKFGQDERWPLPELGAYERIS